MAILAVQDAVIKQRPCLIVTSDFPINFACGKPVGNVVNCDPLSVGVVTVRTPEPAIKFPLSGVTVTLIGQGTNNHSRGLLYLKFA